MTGITRTRERDTDSKSLTGSLYREWGTMYKGNWIPNNPSTSTTITSEYQRGHEYCNDRLTIDGVYDDYPLRLWRKLPERIGGVTGYYQVPDPIVSTWSSCNRYTYTDYHVSRNANIFHPAVKDRSPTRALEHLASFMARSASLGGGTNIPLFLWELKELPSLLKDTGDVLSGRRTASPSEVHLATTFGWEPLISDLRSLINFQEMVQSRLNRLLRLSKDTSIRLSLFEYEWSEPVGTPFPCGGDVYAQAYDEVLELAWGTARWSPNDSVISDLHQQAVDAAPYFWRSAALLSRSDISASTLWNAIPWSFVVDYFTTIGTALEYYSNRYNGVLTDVCIMQRTEALETSRVFSNPRGLSYTSHSFKRIWKYRDIYHAPTSAPIVIRPILTSKQMINLAALATAPRLRSYHGTL